MFCDRAACCERSVPTPPPPQRPRHTLGAQRASPFLTDLQLRSEQDTATIARSTTHVRLCIPAETHSSAPRWWMRQAHPRGRRGSQRGDKGAGAGRLLACRRAAMRFWWASRASTWQRRDGGVEAHQTGGARSGKRAAQGLEDEGETECLSCFRRLTAAELGLRRCRTALRCCCGCGATSSVCEQCDTVSCPRSLSGMELEVMGRKVETENGCGWRCVVVAHMEDEAMLTRQVLYSVHIL
ncbi:hypothetical protein C8R45DRAFT_1042641 [Mycena sanguinolenta]|nr:hypothetical protein C8R45DRAFT_1042641 [Mycena sanguinolenta]